MYGGLLQKKERKTPPEVERSVQGNGATAQFMTGISNLQDMPPMERERKEINGIIEDIEDKLGYFPVIT